MIKKKMIQLLLRLYMFLDIEERSLETDLLRLQSQFMAAFELHDEAKEDELNKKMAWKKRKREVAMWAMDFVDKILGKVVPSA